MCVIAVVGLAPCQCFSPGGNQTTSPGRISSIGPPSRCTQPTPKVTINVWPSGCVCQAVLALGSKVTTAPATRAGDGAVKSGSMRTVPVNQSAGPLPDGCEPTLLISICFSSHSITDGLGEIGPHLTSIRVQSRVFSGMRNEHEVMNRIHTMLLQAMRA